MTAHESVQAAAQLRFRMYANNRLRLETLAALSKVFREHNEPIQDELLGNLVFAVPQELLGEAPPGRPGHFEAKGQPSAPPPPGPRPQPGRPSAPPPGQKPGRPSAPPPGKHH
jgi:hypothetical protein